MPRKTRNCKGSRRRRGTRRLRGGDKAPEVKVGDKFTRQHQADKTGYVVTDVKNKGREVHARALRYDDNIIITWRPRSNQWAKKSSTPKDERSIHYLFGKAEDYLDPHI
jgi:hypothetical protein